MPSASSPAMLQQLECVHVIVWMPRSRGKLCWDPCCSFVLNLVLPAVLPACTAANGEDGPSGSNQWERTASIIDFNFTRPNGTGETRLRV